VHSHIALRIFQELPKSGPLVVKKTILKVQLNPTSYESTSLKYIMERPIFTTLDEKVVDTIARDLKQVKTSVLPP
jgi:hypothetical protein